MLEGMRQSANASDLGLKIVSKDYSCYDLLVRLNCT